MCGIAGIIGNRAVNTAAVEHMNLLQEHRGPDDQGIWRSSDGKVVLGHRRLAIIDTSQAGHQPMVAGAQIITFNGEIYNYLEIAAKLKAEGVQLSTASDTEVLLKAYQHWGEAALDELNGMFAFAILDTEQQRLFCARDRFGEKPFLFHSSPDNFSFGSEYKALLALDNTAASYDQDRVLRFLYHPTRGLDDDIQTVFDDIKQLPPGHSLTLNTQTLEFNIQRYWDVRPNEAFTKMSEPDAQAHFRELFSDAIKLRMRSDVPLGSCLSGGLDSSSIVCLAKEIMGEDTSYDVFTGRFPNSEADEWSWAEQIIKHTNSKSHVTEPTAENFSNELAQFMWHNELPVGSASQYAQYCVFRLAKEAGITVLLDGQGGDELLGGYEQYFENYINSLSSNVSGEREKIAERYPLALLTKGQNAKLGLPHSLRHFLAGLTGKGSDFSFGLSSSAASRLHKNLPPPPASAAAFHPLAGALYQEMLHTHLPVLLRYGDRNSMAHSREVRLPFCDHRLAEISFSLPPEYLMGGAETKRLLRGATKGVLPEAVRTRWNKQGFLPPQADWFKSTLGKEVERIINGPEFEHSDLWRRKWWQAVLERFNAGEMHLATMLWRPIIENAWRTHFLDRIAADEKVAVFESPA
ncbi:MAG: asparagine synthase (glutamine-hydrolyzing) [Rhodospirillaceae bacterium]|nr:asparagine synthase (glutamine-hydrolyzing) [Rhodospirillaceae bacterium]